MKKSRKILAAILSVLIFMGIFSCSTTVFAEEYNSYVAEQEYQEKLLTETVENEKPQAEIICEVSEKRDEYSKTYKRADGSFTTVFSQTALHTYKDGEWKEIDNSLQSNGDVIDNTAGTFNIEFPENLSAEDKITIENQGENISFSINNIEQSTAEVATEAESSDIVENDLSKPVSEIKYENIDENTDVQYIVSASSVKENIIVSDKESLKNTYSFEIEKGNLAVTVGEDKSLTFKNAQGEVAFTIPAPVMTDAENAVSYDIAVSVKNENTNTLTLTYTPSKEWLESNERVYPVTIDPVIEMPSADESIIQDTMIVNASEIPESKATNYSSYVDGIATNTGKEETNNLIHAEILVNINTSNFSLLQNPEIEITDVNYRVRGSVVGGNVLAKEINGTWTADTITYNDVYPGEDASPVVTYGTEIIDFASGGANQSVDDIYFNITDIFRKALAENTNADFAIVAEDNSAVRADFTTGGTESTRTYNSFVTVDYVDTSCGNDSFEYLTQEVGRAGTAYVNTFSRSLSMTRNDISMDGLRMPVNVGFAFNPALQNYLDYYFSAFPQTVTIPYGNNWLPLNMQGIVCISENQWQAFTGEGTIVAFNQINETVTETVDGVQTTTTQIVFEPDETSDIGYVLELVDETLNPSRINLRLISPDGTATYFNNLGLCTAICDSETELTDTTEAIRYSYAQNNASQITKITDGVGRQYVFSYNATTGLLEKINCLTADGAQIKAGTTNEDLCVTYTYDTNGNLTGVKYPDGKTVGYAYENGSLVKAENIDNYNIQYIYDTQGKVTKVEEFADTTAGNLITLEQLSNRQVKIIDAYAGTQVQQFGRDGKLHYTFDDKGNYCKSDYAPSNDENVYTENGWAVAPENLLKNGSFDIVEDNKPTYWNNTFSVVSDVTNAFDNYCKLYSTTSVTQLQSQTVDVNGERTFTFSLYAKNISEETSSTDKLYLRITATDENEEEFSKSIQILPTKDFAQYSVTIDVKPTEDNPNPVIDYVTVEFGLKNKTGNFLVNNAQLERGNGTADFNYIENGSFNNSNNHWEGATLVTDSINGEDVNAVKLTGGLPSYANNTLTDNVSSVTQTVKINGKKDEIFSVGGWFKGQFDDNHITGEVDVNTSQAVNSLAQIKVSYSYAETTTDENGNETTETKTEIFAVDFAPNNDGWQYAVDSFALKADVTTVDVTVMAKNIITDSFATNISLTKNENSEIIEDETTDEETADETCSCDCEDCTYGENCPCTGAVENKCQCVDCLRGETTTEDEFGNTLSNKSTDGISYIETFSSYTTDGNYLASYTDENGNVATYDYNTLNGILEAVTSPMGTGESTDTTTTSYEYDAMGNVVSVSTDNKALQYVYTNDRLTELFTPNGKFKIIYDAWGQILSVNVVTTNGTLVPLVTYTYNSNALRTQVKTATYRNSATNSSTYRYEYNTAGNITNISINNIDKHSITYSSLGEITGIKNKDGRTVKYTDNGVYIYNASDELVYTSVTDSEGKGTEENYGVMYNEQDSQYDYDYATGNSTQSTALEIADDYRISQSAVTDWFGREKSHATTVYNIAGETEQNPATTLGRITTEYSYSVATDGKTSSNVEKYINKTYNCDSTEIRVFDGYSYEYDKQNRISAIKQVNALGTETEMYSYEYDKLGQLVRYNDKIANKSYTYTYDGNGNILTKSEYAYTTGVLGVATDTTTYTYDSQWKDKLTSVGGQPITYDNIGNPTSYLGANLVWEGRQLTSYSKDDNTYNYEYDENGMRYRTTIVDNENDSQSSFEYVWVDGKLISLVYVSEDSTTTAKYLYNDFDEPIGMVLTDDTGSVSTYYYLKNAQGDITRIVSAAGKKMVTFTYDVFGKISEAYQASLGSLEHAKQTIVRILTPFGYRGYCYDTYTGLYYLQSRYYDPDTGRFINADDTNYLNATGTVLGCNLFAYCENDAVNKVDPRGFVSLKYIAFGIQFCISVGKITGGVEIIFQKTKSKWNVYVYLFAGTSTSFESKKNIFSIITNKIKNFKNKTGRISLKDFFRIGISASIFMILGNNKATLLGDYSGWFTGVGIKIWKGIYLSGAIGRNKKTGAIIGSLGMSVSTSNRPISFSQTYYVRYTKGSTLTNLIKCLRTDIYDKVAFMATLGALLL